MDETDGLKEQGIVDLPSDLTMFVLPVLLCPYGETVDIHKSITILVRLPEDPTKILSTCRNNISSVYQVLTRKDLDLIRFDWDNLQNVNGNWILERRNDISQDVPLIARLHCRISPRRGIENGRWKVKRIYQWEPLEELPETIELGHYISNREKRSLDRMMIDLRLFAPQFRQKKYIQIIAKFWKLITDSPELTWLNEKDESGRFRYLSVTDHTFTQILFRKDEMDKSFNVITGETQVGKSEDIYVLCWVCARLGFLPIVLTRCNNGRSTAVDISSAMERFKNTALRMLQEADADATEDLVHFFTTVALNRDTKALDVEHRKSQTTLGFLSNGLVVVDLANSTTAQEIGNTIRRVIPDGENYRCCAIIDEDDESVSTWDANGSKRELYMKRMSMEEVRQQSTYRRGKDPDVMRFLDPFYKGKTFRDSMMMIVSITATAASLWRNGYEQNVPIYTFKKTVPLGYHGIKCGDPCLQIKFVNVSKPLPKKPKIDNLLLRLKNLGGFRSLKAMEKKLQVNRYLDSKKRCQRDNARKHIERHFRDKREEVQEILRSLYKKIKPNSISERYKAIFDDMFDEASNDYEIDSHVNMLLAGEWKEIDNMKHLCHRLSDAYGSKHATVCFAYNSNNTCSFYVNRQNNTLSMENIHNMESNLRTSYATTLSKTNGVSFNIEGNIAFWNIRLGDQKKRSTFVYYDIAKFISDNLEFCKPFFVCVAAALAERQATFKDSKHKYFVTHMYVSFHNKDMTTVVQKVGRITSRDEDRVTTRKLYVDIETHRHICKVFEDKRNYDDLFTMYPGLTFEKILLKANNEQVNVFKDILGSDVMLHRKKYSIIAKDDIGANLADEYMETLENHVRPEIDIPTTTTNNCPAIVAVLRYHGDPMRPSEIIEHWRRDDLLYDLQSSRTYGGVICDRGSHHYATQGRLEENSILANIRGRDRTRYKNVLTYSQQTKKLGLVEWDNDRSWEEKVIRWICILKGEFTASRYDYLVFAEVMRNQGILGYEAVNAVVTTARSNANIPEPDHAQNYANTLQYQNRSIYENMNMVLHLKNYKRCLELCTYHCLDFRKL